MDANELKLKGSEKMARDFLEVGLIKHDAEFGNTYIDDHDSAWAGVIEGAEEYAKYILESYKNSQKPNDPIMLTEDWLLKFGFIIFVDEYVYQPTYFKISRVNGEFFFNVEGNVTGKPLKFVHELQNLYFAINREVLTLNP